MAAQKSRLIHKFLKILKNNRKIVLRILILIIPFLLANIYLWQLPYDPIELGKFSKDLPPSQEHLLGTTTFGRDVLSEICVSINSSFVIVFIAAIIGTLMGAFMGFTMGYYGGKVDLVLDFITDIFLILPMLAILVVIAAFMKRVELWVMGLLISMFSWSGAAKAIRSQTLSLKERDFITIAQLSGERKSKIIVKELMPQMVQYIGSNFFAIVSWAISVEAALGILGLGSQHMITIGTMLNRALNAGAMIRNIWWWWTPPLVVILWLITSLYLIHVALDEVVDPRLRER